MPVVNTNIFTGFSTAGTDLDKNWTKYDIELIKRDLYNHFQTRVGERVMRPEYGCRIWEYLMEQSTGALRDLIVAEAVRICEEDTRVIVQNVEVYSAQNSVRVEIDLLYSPFGVAETFAVDFNNNTPY